MRSWPRTRKLTCHTVCNADQAAWADNATPPSFNARSNIRSIRKAKAATKMWARTRRSTRCQIGRMPIGIFQRMKAPLDLVEFL